ncbi:MAG: TonB-dependent receptor [Bacteroidales bacterium]
MELKIAFLIILVSVSNVLAISTYSQVAKVSLDMGNRSLEQVMDEIERQSEFYFIFNQKQIDVNRVVDIQAENKLITDILPELFKGTNVNYAVFDRKILLTTDPLENSLLSMALGTNPQQVTVKGTVTDATTGEALSGVNVVVRGTTIGVMTDASGNYTIEVPSASATLQFSFVGYATQEIALGGRTTLNVSLLTDVEQLREVVVVGYGTQLKKDLTGSVASVQSTRLLDKPAFNVAQAIGGKIAGVKVIEANGAPGGNPFIRVRGTNSISSNNAPLFVVDGIVGVANALTILNPNEIQSIDVLKDASATAIYGARGANGVIIITTKRGFAGKTTVEYNGYVTRGIRQKDFVYNNTEGFLYVTKQAWLNINKYATTANNLLNPFPDLWPAGFNGTSFSDLPWLFEKTTQGGYSIPLLGEDGSYYKPRYDTNYESLIFVPSTSTNHQISIRGGNEMAKFGTFFNYALEDGLLLNSYFNRYSGKLNGDFKITKWLNISSQIIVNKNKERTNDVSYFSGGISRAVSETFPLIPPQYPNDPTIYKQYAGLYGQSIDFPVGEADCQNAWQISKTVETFTDRSQFTGDVTLNFLITPDLTFKSNFAVDDNSYKYNNYGGRVVSRASFGNANINVQKAYYWQNENYFNYNKVVGGHSLSALLGLSWSRYRWENLNAQNNNYFDDFYKWHNLSVGTAPRPNPTSSDGQNSLNSYFARANYSYKGKYLMTVTGRVDGSSKFGANSKYGFFPSGSLAWRISEEEFMQNIAALSNLKLRFSVGQTGNQEIGSYVTQTFLSTTNVVLNAVLAPALYASSVGNPDLKWEKTTQYNGGVDIGLYGDRIVLALDYYNKLTKDMLLDVPLPQSTTTGSVRKNYGSVENKGFEVQLSTHNIKSTNFNWYTDLSWSTNKNTIVQLGPTGADINRNSWVGGPNTVLRVGESIASYLGLTRLGTYSTQEASLAARYGFVPGDVKYLDKNNDGLISYLADSKILGNAFPIWDLDLTNTIDFRNFDFMLDLRFSYGAKKENRTNHSGEDRQVMDNSKNRVLDAWTPYHQNTMIGEVRPGMGGAYYQTYPDTWWIEDASFIRGEGATLGYTLPSNIIGGLSRLRVYFTAKNFFVLTKYSGYDPEGSDSGNMGDSLTPGMDFYMYPRPSTYTFGVNIAF